MTRKKEEVEPDQTVGEIPEEEAVEADVPQKWVCIRPCIYKNQKYTPGMPPVMSVKRPNQNFQLESDPVKVPSVQAASALPQDIQKRIQDLVELNGMKLNEVLTGHGLNSLAAFPLSLAQTLIGELEEQYKKQRQGPEVRSDVRTGEEPAE